MFKYSGKMFVTLWTSLVTRGWMKEMKGNSLIQYWHSLLIKTLSSNIKVAQMERKQADLSHLKRLPFDPLPLFGVSRMKTTLAAP